MTNVRIGTCGYTGYDPGEGWKDEYESKLHAYSTEFSTVEINQTFYELPMVKTTERWRREADESCDIAMKAWQALTHPWRSPTWNTHREDVDEERAQEFGYLRPNDQVVAAWNETRARADALESPVVLLQTPASFDATEEHERNLRELVDRIDRGEHVLAWEPRGDWKNQPDRIAEICDDLDLVHVVDLMRDKPVSSHEVAYVRMHGLNEDPYDYDYDYSEEELDELADRIRELGEDHERIYCQFNNYEKFDNATSLMDRFE